MNIVEGIRNIRKSSTNDQIHDGDLNSIKEATDAFIKGVKKEKFGKKEEILSKFKNKKSLHKTIGWYHDYDKELTIRRSETKKMIDTFLEGESSLTKLFTGIAEVGSLKTDLKDLDNKIEKLDKEKKKEEKTSLKMMNDPELLKSKQYTLQEEKTKGIAHEYLTKTKDKEQLIDKTNAQIRMLLCRENQYAFSIVEILKRQRQLYEDAQKLTDEYLKKVEEELRNTEDRPVFGEDLSDHLRTSKRKIALPIALAVTYLREKGLNDEGLFRISTQQLKIDKFKARVDSKEDPEEFLKSDDVHFFASMLKCYLRELPLPLLGSSRNGSEFYKRWIHVPQLPTKDDKITKIRYILKELNDDVHSNIQFLFEFLADLTKKSDRNKMTPSNLAIVIGPSVLWDWEEQNSQKDLIAVNEIVTLLVENYKDIFPISVDWKKYEDVTKAANLIRKARN